MIDGSTNPGPAASTTNDWFIQLELQARRVPEIVRNNKNWNLCSLCPLIIPCKISNFYSLELNYFAGEDWRAYGLWYCLTAYVY